MAWLGSNLPRIGAALLGTWVAASCVSNAGGGAEGCGAMSSECDGPLFPSPGTNCRSDDDCFGGEVCVVTASEACEDPVGFCEAAGTGGIDSGPTATASSTTDASTEDADTSTTGTGETSGSSGATDATTTGESTTDAETTSGTETTRGTTGG